jgi:ABC-type polysaccharide/polyol phosphate transport system ATPase subunit
MRKRRATIFSSVGASSKPGAVHSGRSPRLLLMNEGLIVGDAGFEDKAEVGLVSLIESYSFLVFASHD